MSVALGSALQIVIAIVVVATAFISMALRLIRSIRRRMPSCCSDDSDDDKKNCGGCCD